MITKTIGRLAAITLFWASTLVIAPAPMAAEDAPAPDQAQAVKQKTAEAIEAIKQYSATQRDQALVRARELLQELDGRIARLKAWIDQHWDQMQADSRKHAQEALARLQSQRAKLNEAYKRLEASSNSAWEDVKQGFLKSYRTMRKAFSETKQDL